MSSEAAGQTELEQTDWEEAIARGRRALEGTRRFRVEGGSPGVELSALDWGEPASDPSGHAGLVVLHHANGFCGATLAPIAARLAERFRVVALDARGHGESTPVRPGGEPDPYEWETLALDAERAVLQILEHTGRERVHLGIGHSFGGALLLRVARARPALVERLLLCDPVILPPLTPEQIAERGRGPSLATLSRKRRDHFPSYAAAYDHCRKRPLFAPFTPETLALYVGEGMKPTSEGEVTLKCHREFEAAIFDGGGGHSVLTGLDTVEAEVLIVHAGRGNFHLDHYREIAAQMPDARAETFDLGHLFPLEVPDRVVEFAEKAFRS